jgi:hypothetical protein
MKSTITWLVPPGEGGGKMAAEIKIGDVVRLRKVHPCGGNEWQVVRLGADIGLKCLECGRRILLNRSVFERRVKKYLRRSA